MNGHLDVQNNRTPSTKLNKALTSPYVLQVEQRSSTLRPQSLISCPAKKRGRSHRSHSSWMSILSMAQSRSNRAGIIGIIILPILTPGSGGLRSWLAARYKVEANGGCVVGQAQPTIAKSRPWSGIVAKVVLESSLDVATDRARQCRRAFVGQFSRSRCNKSACRVY
jgi:hypothetical protein